MMKFRFRNQTNTWPAFVDLFSNLAIILIFLLIVFVFLWTTTSVFNKTLGPRLLLICARQMKNRHKKSFK